MSILLLKIDNTPIPESIINNAITVIDCRDINNFCSVIGETLVGDLVDSAGKPLYRSLFPVGNLLMQFREFDRVAFDSISQQWFSILLGYINNDKKLTLVIDCPQTFLNWLLESEDERFNLIGIQLKSNRNRILIELDDVEYATSRLGADIQKIIEKETSAHYIAFSSPIIKDAFLSNNYLKTFDILTQEKIFDILDNKIQKSAPHIAAAHFNDLLEIESSNIIVDEVMYDFESYRLKFWSFRIELEEINSAISIRLLLKVKKIDSEVITITINDKYFDYSYTEFINLKRFNIGDTITLNLPLHKMLDGLHFVEIKSTTFQLINYIFDVSRYRTIIEEIWPSTKENKPQANDYKGVLLDIIHSTNRQYIIGNHGHGSACVGFYELDNLLSILWEKQVYNDELSYEDMISELKNRGYELVSHPKYRYGDFKVFNAIIQKIDNPLVITIVIENASDYSAQSLNTAIKVKGNWVQVAVGLLEHYPSYLKNEFANRGILSCKF